MAVRTDIHTHILPDMDDGCANAEQSITLLKALAADGVRRVYLTPHYRSDSESVESFLKRRDRAMQQLRAALPADFPIELRLGSETTLSDVLLRNESLDALCLEGTRCLLLELNYNTRMSDRLRNRIYRLQCEYDVVPMLAHVERYRYLRQREPAFCELLASGCLAQVNLDTLSTWYRGRVYHWIRSGYVQAVGTDCHRPDRRPARYGAGIQALERRLSRHAVDRVANASILERIAE